MNTQQSLSSYRNRILYNTFIYRLGGVAYIIKEILVQVFNFLVLTISSRIFWLGGIGYDHFSQVF